MRRSAAGTRERLERGDTLLGCFLRYPDAGLAELLALQGLDVVVFDGEHGVLTPPACEHLTRAVELHGVTAGVRVEANHGPSILRYLDAGAVVCHVPGIESGADAERAVRAVKFHPYGDRGLSASRASGYGASDGYAAYVERANGKTVVVAHVESAAGAAAADEIAAVQGLDVLLIGALDLSHDLGHPGDVDHPDVISASERIATAAVQAGKTLGVVVGNPEALAHWHARGARYLLTTVESFLVPSVARFRAAVQANASAGG